MRPSSVAPCPGRGISFATTEASSPVVGIDDPGSSPLNGRPARTNEGIASPVTSDRSESPTGSKLRFMGSKKAKIQDNGGPVVESLSSAKLHLHTEAQMKGPAAKYMPHRPKKKSTR